MTNLVVAQESRIIDPRTYRPQFMGQIKPREVLIDPRYQTLRENRKLVQENPEVALYYIKNRGQGFLPRTFVFYDLDDKGNDKLKWVEGPVNPMGSFEYCFVKFMGVEGKEGSLILPPTGWVEAEKDGGHWIYFDVHENGGFGRKTAPDTVDGRKQAEETLVRAWKDGGLFGGLTEEEQVRALASKQERLPSGKHGARPVGCYSASYWGTLHVGTFSVFKDFGDLFEGYGALFASDLEQSGHATPVKI